MKFFLSLILAALLAACSNNKPKENTTLPAKDGKEPTSMNQNPMNALADEMEKKKEELSNLTPLTTEQLTSLLPEKLGGIAKLNYNVSTAMGTGLAVATYKITDTSEYVLNIYDCAGSAGAGFYSMQYLTLLNIKETKESEYRQTIDLNGGKALEHCFTPENNCTLTFFTGNRYLVTIDGNHTGIEALKDAAKGLSLK